MNLKKITASLISIITLAIIGVVAFQNTAYATDATTPMYIGVAVVNPNSNSGYAIREPVNGGVRIWNFLKYDSNSTNSSYTVQPNFYCLKSGVGFTDASIDQDTLITTNPVTYNRYYNMKTQKGDILSKNDTTLNSIINGNVQNENEENVSKYSALLALLDRLYYPTSTSTDGDREEFLVRAGIEPLEYAEGNLLTDEEIRAVQQSAIWYFTNYGETSNGQTDGIANFYDNTGSASWLTVSTDGRNYTNLSDGGTNSQQRNLQANTLYNYLIETAIANASKYDGTSTTSEAPATVTTTKINWTVEGDNYILGPINITELDSSRPYNVEISVKNGETPTNYKILNSNSQEVTDIKTMVGQDFYIAVNKTGITSINIGINIKYDTTNLTLWTYSTNDSTQPIVVPDKNSGDKEFNFVVTPGAFDLALRKYIVSVNGTDLTGASSRVPVVDESTLSSDTTATYKHKKDPVVVKEGNKVIYNLTIYNEGEKAGRATKITDQLPTGLKYKRIVNGNFVLDSYDETNNTLKLKRADGNEINLPAYTSGSLTSGTGTETIQIECEVTAVADTKNKKVLTNLAWISEAYNADDSQTITNQLKSNYSWADRDSEPATITTKTSQELLTSDNGYTGNGNKDVLTDSDYYYKGQQDDDDFEKLVLMPESFDLKLIKRIVSVNDNPVTERIKSIDVSSLNLVDANGNMLVDSTSEKYTTAVYNLNKEPVGVKKGDIVTYTFRVYNEGTINGYVQKITENIPEGLEFLYFKEPVTSIKDLQQQLANDETLTEAEKEAILFNSQNLWGFDEDKIDANGRVTEIHTEYLAKENGAITSTGGNENLIEAFGRNDGSKTVNDLHYKEVSVKLKVISENVSGTVIRNEACISDDMDENEDPADDRDSKPEEWPGKDDHSKYQDDEDYDNIILQSFDLALRKFIIAVSKDETIEESEYLKNEDGSYTRAPVVDTSKLNEKDENGNIKTTTAIYNHTKEPVLVQANDIVIYNLRVYNEGEIDGYAAEIKDHLPSYLEFVDGEFNKKYGWTVSEDGRTVTTKYLANEIIKKAEAIENTDESESTQKYKLTYKEVPIMCKVKASAPTSENITNIADITLYLDENKIETTDRDSEKDNVKLPEDKDLPNYKGNETGTYVPGQQDDDDFEKVIIKKFDLALRKWVTQAIVIENGNQTVTETGHDAWDDPEQVVKVELHRKKINAVTVKFKYSIRVYNQGEIAGYAKEVTDYVPEGLKFVAEDNPGWTDEGNNVISTTLLANKLLQPGEYADVEVVLTWINNANNMGVMTNIAEISKDENEYGVPDIDSTPDNKKTGEDDIDDAPVMLSVSTGQIRIYFTLGFIILITIAGGVVLIKKYVL